MIVHKQPKLASYNWNQLQIETRETLEKFFTFWNRNV